MHSLFPYLIRRPFRWSDSPNNTLLTRTLFAEQKASYSIAGSHSCLSRCHALLGQKFWSCACLVMPRCFRLVRRTNSGPLEVRWIKFLDWCNSGCCHLHILKSLSYCSASWIAILIYLLNAACNYYFSKIQTNHREQQEQQQ